MTQRGDVVVQKDWKVLLVDTGALPARFGDPPLSHVNAAVVIGKVIMGCWTGA
jgi:hypothetical protein